MEYQRNIEKLFQLYLKVFPVVLLTGARQTGKTTFVQRLAKKHGYGYVTLDDLSQLKAAKEDPVSFLKFQSKPVILDEIQRVPELFLTIKKQVDEEKLTGQFLLTGSANPLLLPKLGDSLAGRMGILNMFPLSQGELQRKKEDFLSWVFSADFQMETFTEIGLDALCALVVKGGFPRVQAFTSPVEQGAWLEGYLRATMDRDILEIAQVEGLYHFPDLFRLLASRSGSLLNGADLSRTLKISTASVHRYLSLLETLFFIFREPAWFSNHGKRIAKSPKVYICDTGILCHLLNINQEQLKSNSTLFGTVLESFVVGELLKQASWMEKRIKQYHYREGMHEVDVVLEDAGGKIVGVEVKSGATVGPGDFDGLKQLKETAREKFLRGIVLYTGSAMIPFGPDLWAIPLPALWEK